MDVVAGQTFTEAIVLRDCCREYIDCVFTSEGQTLPLGRASYQVKIEGGCTVIFRRCVFGNMTGEYIRGVLASRHNVPFKASTGRVVFDRCAFKNFIAVPEAEQSNEWRFECDAVANLGEWLSFSMEFRNCDWRNCDGRFVKSQNPGCIIAGGLAHAGTRTKVAIAFQDAGGSLTGTTLIGPVHDAVVISNQLTDRRNEATEIRDCWIHTESPNADIIESKSGDGIIRVSGNQVHGDYRSLYRIDGNTERLVVEDT